MFYCIFMPMPMFLKPQLLSSSPWVFLSKTLPKKFGKFLMDYPPLDFQPHLGLHFQPSFRLSIANFSRIIIEHSSFEQTTDFGDTSNVTWLSKDATIVFRFHYNKVRLTYTLKPVYNGQPWDPQKAAFVQRWPLFRGSSYTTRCLGIRIVDRWPLFGGGH